MISKKMQTMVNTSSPIREMFEEGKKLAKLHGSDQVFDFSLGNPNMPVPKEVTKTLLKIIKTTESEDLHGYMSNSGYEDTRKAVALSLNRRYDASFTIKNICMTVGAAGGLNVVLKSIINPKDEVVVFAPYFGEYKNYVENFDGKLVVVPPNPPFFEPKMSDIAAAITAKTKAVIINSPNNPTGIIYSRKFVADLSKLLDKMQKEWKSEIYLISDEPYRDIVYDDYKVPYLPKIYNNTIIVYSWSKSLSLAGERIGYIAVPNECADCDLIINACSIATRILGFVNAPSLQQKLIEKCVDSKIDMFEYSMNRDTLMEYLLKLGFEYVEPIGAFYLFLKSPIADDVEFCARAKQFKILMVPGSAFGCKGYVRIAYCQRYKKVKASFSAFEKLAEDYNMHK